ncbi:hypothetical protein [Leptolyngbya ohadii]|uniref:hypothetical protein n=1 Tax=Leptolyngbya ohadii TaxID=1962290 RepID=UPI000B5A009F|nr:hypothetical protein [Leptolyngbya ohadii]
MKSPHVLSLFLLSLGTLAGCNLTKTQLPATVSSPAPSIAVSPAVSPTPNPPPTAPSLFPSPTPATEIQIYREKTGKFEVAFPKGFVYQDTGSGVAFASADQGFAGAVDFGSAQGQKLTTGQLEAALKAEYQNRLKEVSWTRSTLQPDGSLRIDWTGKDEQGSTLDAVSFVEQRGDTLFILNLYGVNQPYQKYEKDAGAIVKSYRIKS